MNLQSEDINELITALSKAQGEISPAIKDSLNPHYKNKYADLNSCWNACRPALSKHGLAIIQTMTENDGKLSLITTLAHSSGQWMRSYLPILTQKMDAQGIGSAITYARRYSLAAIVGIAPDDDDGNAACDAPKQVPQKKKPEPTISDKEATELEEMFDHAPNYKTQVLNFLQESYKIFTFKQLPCSLYPRVKEGILKKLELPDAQILEA